MRKRLIKLIKHCTSCEECRDEDIADYLLVNGVIALPFPIGTTYYRIVRKRTKVGFPYHLVIRKAKLNWYNVESVLSDFGKTVFLTKAEAEKALEDRSEG